MTPGMARNKQTQLGKIAAHHSAPGNSSRAHYVTGRTCVGGLWRKGAASGEEGSYGGRVAGGSDYFLRDLNNGGQEMIPNHGPK